MTHMYDFSFWFSVISHFGGFATFPKPLIWSTPGLSPLVYICAFPPSPVLVSSSLLTLNSMSMLTSLIAISSWGTGTLPGVPDPRSTSHLTSLLDCLIGSQA